MDTQELINDNGIDVTEELAAKAPNGGLIIAVGAAVAIVAGVAAYRYVVRPLAAKIKDRRSRRVTTVENVCVVEGQEVSD